MIEPSLEELGWLAYRPYFDPNHPGRMVVVEEWTSAQALVEHFTTAHFRHVTLAEPMTIRQLVAAPE
jgi:quinol monooxygenase YgiN